MRELHCALCGLCARCVHLRPSIAHGVLYVDSAGFAPRFTRRSADTDRRRDANPTEIPRKKLRPTTHSYLPAFSRRTCIPTVPLTRHFVFASIANSATRVHVNLELSALCSLHSPKVPDQHQKP